jgi:hypothetical protein
VAVIVELTAKVLLRQAALLDLRAHRAVQNEDAAAQERCQLGGAVGCIDRRSCIRRSEVANC